MKKQLFFLVLVLLAAWSLVGCGGGGNSNTEAAAPRATATSAGDAAAGQTLFAGTCSACHGPEGLGVTGLGKNLTTSTFVSERSDAEMLEFLKTGRPASDPLNTTGVDMPPRGGNPSLDDAKLLDVIAFVRSIQK